MKHEGDEVGGARVDEGERAAGGDCPHRDESIPTEVPDGEDDLDSVWRALSNGTRRRMLDILKEGPLTTGALSERFPELSRFAVMQHLRVLEEGDLVVPVRDGRLRYNYLNPVPVQRIYDRWVSDYIQPWTDALTSLKHGLEALEDRRA